MRNGGENGNGDTNKPLTEGLKNIKTNLRKLFYKKIETKDKAKKEIERYRNKEKEIILKIKEKVDARFHNDIDKWCKIKEEDESFSIEEYLEALERREAVLNNKELRAKMGRLLTTDQVEVKDEADVTRSDSVIWMKNKVYEDTLKKHKNYERVDIQDLLDVLNALSGTDFKTIDEAINEGDPIDWAMIAPFLGLTRYDNNPDNAYRLSVSSASDKIIELRVWSDFVSLFNGSNNGNYERLVRIKNS